MKYLGSIFKNLSSNADRIDIVFHVYLETGIKLHFVFASIYLFTFGCGTTSRVGTKKVANQAAIDISYGLFHLHGKEMITEGMVCHPERLLVHCIAKSRVVSLFDDLR